MVARTRPGKCHLCGIAGDLTFEHVPPKKAFNDRPVWCYAGDLALKYGLDELSHGGRQQQRGSGGYTLCKPCNNNTGDWYAREFADWCIKGMGVLRRHRDERSLPIVLAKHRPLRIVKQILTMFCSVNATTFTDAHPELRRYLLNRASTSWPHGFRVFAYYSLSHRLRANGLSARIDLANGGAVTGVSELNFPPFGYVLTVDGAEPPDPRLSEITHYHWYGNDDVVEHALPGALLDTHLLYSGDYRSEDEILQHRHNAVHVTGAHQAAARRTR